MRIQNSFLPAQISGRCTPIGYRLVVDDAFTEKPLSINLDHFILVMAIGINYRFSLRIVVPIMKPVRLSDSLVSVDFQENIDDIVATRCRVRLIWAGLRYHIDIYRMVSQK